MISSFSTGFFLGLSLIIAIGAQNAFVLRQGLLRQHIIYVAFFCSISDSLLIVLGISGFTYFLSDFILEFSKIIFGISSIWLIIYGVLRLRSAFSKETVITRIDSESSNLRNCISLLAVFTFANPHVYLDTMILIGSISQKFSDENRIYFAIGACCASFLWFFSLSYGARLLSPVMERSQSWKILDTLIAIIMFCIAINLLYAGNWL